MTPQDPVFVGTVSEALASPGFFSWDRGAISLVKYFQARGEPETSTQNIGAGASERHEEPRVGFGSTIWWQNSIKVVTFKSYKA